MKFLINNLNFSGKFTLSLFRNLMMIPLVLKKIKTNTLAKISKPNSANPVTNTQFGTSEKITIKKRIVRSMIISRALSIKIVVKVEVKGIFSDLLSK